MTAERPDLYEIKLSMDEVRQYIEGARRTFEEARQNPYGRGLIRPMLRRRRMEIDPEVDSRLTEVIGDLLPLELQDVVQQATLKRQEGEITVSEIARLEGEILVFKSGFKNTGVTRVGSKAKLR